MSTPRALSILTSTLLWGCSDLPSFDLGACGNGIVEPEHGEDCDTVAASGLTCGRPADGARACRFLCTPGGAASCPEAWACGGDGVCRFASGGFEPRAILGRFLGDVEHLASGDFDGDGRVDLFALTKGALSVRFGGADGAIAGEFDLPFPSFGAPAVGDLDGDGRTDVVVPQLEGLVLLRGERDRTLAPVPSPFTTADLGPFELRLIPVAYRSAQIANLENFAFLFWEQRGACLTMAREIEDCTRDARGHPIFFQTSAPSPVLGTVVRRQQVGPLLIEDLILAVEGETRVHHFQIHACSSHADVECVERAKLSAEGAASFDLGLAAQHRNNVVTTGALKLVDHDGDGILDLLIHVRYTGPVPAALAGRDGNDSDGVLVARGRLSGFDPPRYEPMFQRLAFGADGRARTLAGSVWPLAGGNLDDDPAADYVSSEAIFVRRGPLLAAVAVPSLGTWADAVIADFNRDGLLDVAAASREFEGIDFFSGTGQPLLNPARIGTRARARLLRAGDFDGDRVTDLAFVELTPRRGELDGRGPIETRIGIAFGSLQGPPTAPVDIGPLDGITDLVPTMFINGDLIGDLLVQSKSSATGKTSVALLAGTASRRMFSTLVPPSDERVEEVDLERPNRTLGVSVGAFNSASSARDIFAVRERDQWLLSAAGAASFPTELMDPVRLQQDCPELSPPLDLTCAAVTTGRVRAGAAVDSVVVFDTPSGCTGLHQTARLTVVDLDPMENGGARRCWSTQVAELPGGIPTQATLLDLDGNDVPELLVVYGFGHRSRDWRDDGPDQSITSVEQSGLAVYWNLGGAGKDRSPGSAIAETPVAFSNEDVVHASGYAEVGHEGAIRDPGSPSPAPPVGLAPGFLAAAPINVDDDPEMELAVLTTEGVFVMDFTGKPAVPELRPLRFAPHDPSHRIHTADLDGDGLLDLIVASGPEFEVLLSIPHDAARPAR